MPAIKLSSFGGTIPALDAHLLSDNMAAAAENTWLYSGALEGIREARAIHTCVDPLTKRVFRIPKQYVDKDHIVDSYWLEFPFKDMDVLKSPTSNDSYSRFYWAGDTGGSIPPRYNTLARIATGSAPFTLGIPSPTVAPVVRTSPSQPMRADVGGYSITAPSVTLVYGKTSGQLSQLAVGGSGIPVSNPSTTRLAVSRAYAYTWVSAYGEEGAPSPATVLTGLTDDHWNITLTAPTSTVTTNRNITNVRIYRTITSAAGVATYFQVAELPIATTSYVDNLSDTAVSANNQLASSNWTPPPTDLAGMTALPNGMFVGFRENEVWFSEPYRPHAWPSDYTLAVDYNVVGIGVIGQTAIICTQAATYAATGTSPAFVTLSKISHREPCLSRGSIVSTPVGVLYASPNGLMLATPGQVENATKTLFTKDKWLNTLQVPQLRGAMLGNSYYCWGSITPGCFEETAFAPGRFEFTDFEGAYTGGIIDASDPRIAYLPLSDAEPVMNVSNDPWTSEVFVLRGGVVYHIDISADRPRSEYSWTSKIFQTSTKQNLEAMKVYFTNPENVSPLGTIYIYADDRLVGTKPLTESGQMIRLPSGFRADFWQIKVVSRVIISNIQMATSARELALV